MATPSAPPYEDLNSSTSGASKENNTDTKKDDKDEEEVKSDFFECNICLDMAKDPVVR